MRVAHWSSWGPGISGMYHTTKDLVLAERRLGIEAELLALHAPAGGLRDGDFEAAPYAFADVADVYVLHARIEPPYYGDGTPTVFLMHGHPLYSWQVEAYRTEEGNANPWTTTLFYLSDLEHVHRFVTLWPSQLPYWDVLLGPGQRERLRCVSRGVDLSKRFVPDGERAALRGRPALLIADSWRLFKDVLAPLFACARVHQLDHDALVTLVGTPPAGSVVGQALRSTIQGSELHRAVAEVHEVRHDIERYYRAADILVTSVRGDSRVVLEALACGCDVVCQSADSGLKGLHEADFRSPETIANTIMDVWEDRYKGGEDRRRAIAAAVRDAVDVGRMAEGMVAIYEELI